MEDAKSASILGSEAPLGEFLSQERKNWLPQIIPPLVHRMNNSLLVVVGSGAPAATSEALAGNEREYDRLSLSLRSLALFSKAQGPKQRSFDLAHLVQAMECLAEPYASELGLELELRIPSGAIMVQGGPLRLQQWVLCLVLTLLKQVAGGAGRHARVAGGDRGAPRLRFSIHQGLQGVALQFSTLCTEGDAQVITDFLGLESEWCLAAGLLLQQRSLGRGIGIRMLLPLPEGRSVVPVVRAAPVPERRALVLLESDGGLRELLGDFLTSESYRVETPAHADELSEAQVRSGNLILDMDSLRQNPALRDRLLAKRSSLQGLLLLGRPVRDELSGPWSQVPSLDKPFRPAELLDLVRALF